MSEAVLIALGVVVALALCGSAFIYYRSYAVRSQMLGTTRWCGNRQDNAVALTFDDGPSVYTPEVLDILKESDAKATFFLIGKNVQKHPQTARRMIEEGHEIGNHSYSHPIFLFCSRANTRLELTLTQDVIKEATGVRPRFARPPCGVRTKAYFAAARQLGLETIQWSVAAFDWKKISAEKIAQNTLDAVQSGSIILLHDGDQTGSADRKATVEALPILLKGLKERNLRIVPLAELWQADLTDFIQESA